MKTSGEIGMPAFENNIFGLSILLFFLFYTVEVFSQPPSGYYDKTSGLKGKALQKSLHEIIKNHTVISYDKLFSCFKKTDVKNDSVVWDMYSDKPNGNSPYTYFYGKGFECGNYSKEGDCFNREHSFPKSWFGDASPMYTDLFHLYPTDGYVNNRRANYPFGETKNATWTSKNSSEVGPSSWPGYSGIVFEPIEEYKGDFARTMFYMATRYYGEDVAWPGSDMVTGAEPKQWAREMLLFWHNNDSVSTKERNRNNEVFKFQNNRNPFIDDPQFAERIWGLPNIMNETISEKNNIRLFPNPARESVCLSSESEIEPETNITICNISGRIVLQIKMNARVQTLHINKLIPGIYFVRIENLYFTKIIKLIRL